MQRMALAARRPPRGLAVDGDTVGRSFAKTLNPGGKGLGKQPTGQHIHPVVQRDSDGTPRANGKMLRKNRSFCRAHCRISTKSSAPAKVPHRITSMISGKG